MMCEIKGKIPICGLIYATVLIANTKGFVNISFSTDETTKNSNLQIIAVTDEPALTWQRNSSQIGICFIGGGCSPAVDNMVFTEVSATSTSTIDITSLNYTTNDGIFRVLTSNDNDQKRLTVYSPVTSISWTDVPSTPVTGTSVNLVAKIPCVYPPSQIEVIFNVYGKDGRNNTIAVHATAVEDSSCENHEFTLTARKTIYLSDVLDNVVQIIPTGSHRSLPSLGSTLGSITPEITLTSIQQEKSDDIDVIGGSSGGCVALALIILVSILIYLKNKNQTDKITVENEDIKYATTTHNDIEIHFHVKDERAKGPWQWYKTIDSGRNEVPLTDDFRTKSSSSLRLLIRNLTREDDGLYFCCNPGGEGLKSGMVQLIVVTDKITVGNENLKYATTTNNDIEIHFHVQDEKGKGPWQWYKTVASVSNVVPLTDDVRTNSSSSLRLLIRNLTYEDEGFYFCRNLGGERLQSGMVQLIVVANLLPIGLTDKECTTSLGSKVALQFTKVADYYEWFTKSVDKNASRSICKDQYYVIDCVSKTDEGFYFCQATYKKWDKLTRSGKARMVVKGDVVTLHHQPTSYTVACANSIEIQIKDSDIAKNGSLEWEKKTKVDNGSVITIDGKKYKCPRRKRQSLIIKDVTENDEGIYYCHDTKTDIRQQINLKVVKVSLPVSLNKSAETVQFGDSVNLCIEGASNNDIFHWEKHPVGSMKHKQNKCTPIEQYDSSSIIFDHVTAKHCGDYVCYYDVDDGTKQLKGCITLEVSEPVSQISNKLPPMETNVASENQKKQKQKSKKKKKKKMSENKIQSNDNEDMNKS